MLIVIIFLMLGWWKFKLIHSLYSFSLLLWNYLLLLKILPITRFKDPKAVNLRLGKMLTGSRLLFCKIISEAAACDKLILAHFPAANERSALENFVQSQRREFWGGFQKATANNLVFLTSRNLPLGTYGWKIFQYTLAMPRPDISSLWLSGSTSGTGWVFLQIK